MTSGLSPLDIEGLVAQVLGDEQLRKTTAKAGLQREQIVEAVRAQSAGWEQAGQVDTRGRLDEARRREQAIGEQLENAARHPWWLWLYYAVICAFGVLGVVSGLANGESPPIAVLAAALVIGPLVGLAVVIVRIRSRRRSRLEADAHRAALESVAAREELKRELAEALVKPLIRYELNAREGSRYDTTISAVESEGLAEILNPKYLVSTDAARRLDRFLKDMPGGSIGLSGPRGAGKSSLIQAECPSGDNQPEGLLGVVVSAPVQFEPRDFILHLFSELCMAVLGRDAVERLRNPSALPRAATGLAWALAGSLLVALLGAAIVVNELLDRPSDIVLGVAVTVVGLASAGVLATLRARTVRSQARRLSRLWNLRVELTPQRFSASTHATAERQLRAIWFQQTFSEGWSGALKLPGGLQGGVEGGQELARQQMSLPDIVSELRRLIAAVTEDGDVRVRIGIDELDKIDSPEHAARFFNEIKVLFGIVDCFFLVSVSEDALASFERRGMPVRDVFDSSFDDVIRLDHLRAHSSIAMLRERVVGLPTPFLLLCHCLSGGLPRDLIRIARDLVSLLPEEPAEAELGLSEACAELVTAQLAAKAGGVTTAARRLLPPQEAVEIGDLADRLSGGASTAERLYSYVRASGSALGGVASEDAGGGGSETYAAMLSFAAELTTFAYFCATLLDLFDQNLPESHFAGEIHQEDVALRDGDRSVVDQLAYARQAFAVHPRAAWSAITNARLATGMHYLPDYPFAPAFSGAGQS